MAQAEQPPLALEKTTIEPRWEKAPIKLGVYFANLDSELGFNAGGIGTATLDGESYQIGFLKQAIDNSHFSLLGCFQVRQQ